MDFLYRLSILRFYHNLSSDLSWSNHNHIEYICNKAKRMLGILYRQFSSNSNETALIRLCLTLVRPLLEYGAEVWHPHLIKDTLSLENVQKLALRICSKQWQMSYYDLLDRFKLPTLENRRLFLSLCTFFNNNSFFFLLLLSLPIYHHHLFVLLIVTIFLFILLILSNQLILLFYV